MSYNPYPDLVAHDTFAGTTTGMRRNVPTSVMAAAKEIKTISKAKVIVRVRACLYRQ